MLNQQINDYIKKCTENKEIANIIIAGCSCSGKTTLAENIREAYKNKTIGIIHLDDYFKNLKDIPISKEGVLADDINAFYIKEFEIDVRDLLKNGTVYTPIYDLASNHRICKKNKVTRGEINIFEGLYTIDALNDKENINGLRVYINTSNEECLSRRIKRDLNNWGTPEKIVRDYWKRCIEPISIQYILPQSKLADIIIE